MKTLLLSFALAYAFITPARSDVTELKISSAISDNSRMPFYERSAALALNTEYADVKKLRADISKATDKELRFFAQWDPQGEGHVTTITPPEFNQLQPYITQEKINQIALDLDIQASDLKILGIGSGKKIFNGEEGETFFIIVKSRNLLRIRQAIYREYLRNGGPVTDSAFKPRHFFPHITVGFTHSDIHESDGLLKDVQHSLDGRFKLTVVK